MRRTTPIFPALLALIVAAIQPRSAMADMAFYFVDVDCSTVAHHASIKSEVMQDLCDTSECESIGYLTPRQIEQFRSNGFYELHDLAENGPRSICTLAPGVTLFLVGRENPEHPRNNNFDVYLGRKMVGGSYFMDDNSMEISAPNDATVLVHSCVTRFPDPQECHDAVLSAPFSGQPAP